MMTTPTTSIAKLARLRGRERFFLVLWGLTRWLALALTLVTLAVVLDWWIDKSRDTPKWLRVGMTFLQVVGLAAAAVAWVLRPLARGPSLIRLARRVEESIPEYDHRLVTAIQLTRPDARTAGMSAELIGAVAVEAERISGRHDLARLADTRRLKWSAALLAWPLGVAAFLLIFFGPKLMLILLERQARPLADLDIPRNLKLQKYETPRLWPAGDEVTVRYEVTAADGRIDEKLRGTVTVAVAGQPDADYDLTHEKTLADGRAIFAARVPHSSINFRYRARLGDGRTKGWDEVVFEPRPTVAIYGAWVQLPEYVPRRPDGRRYEVEQNNGDVKAYNGSRARVRVHVQKPISDAKLILLLESGSADETGGRLSAAFVPMELRDAEILDDGSTVYPAEAAFDLKTVPGSPRPVRYLVEVTDRYGFANVKTPSRRTTRVLAGGKTVEVVEFTSEVAILLNDPRARLPFFTPPPAGDAFEEYPKRSITVTEPEPPYVQLLPERFAAAGLNLSEEDVIEGLPIPIDGTIPVEYLCRAPVGLFEPRPGGARTNAAWLVVRVNDEEQWRRYPLTEVPETDKTGPWNVASASFANVEYQKTALENQVEFHAKPSPDPNFVPSRREGGGRFDFKTKDLKKTVGGQSVGLEVGDKIEFYVEVYDRDDAPGRPPGRSEARIKEVRTLSEVYRRALETLNSESRIRELEKRQQGVFARPKS
jgi:hypothetical protein